MTFDYWGSPKLMQIPISKYRTELQWGEYDKDIRELDNINVQNFYLYGNEFNNNYLDIPISLTDAFIQEKFDEKSPLFRKDKTGRQNTDILVSYNYPYIYAPKYCRLLNIAGLGEGYFDLPNIYELCVLYAESDQIDLLDPLKTTYLNRKLGKTATKGRFYFNNSLMFSSTERESVRALDVGHNGCIGYYGIKICDYGVIPCRVIDL